MDKLTVGLDRLVLNQSEACGELSNENRKEEGSAYIEENDGENNEENEEEISAEEDLEYDLQDESEIDSDDDGGSPYTPFEASHPWLLNIFKRSSAPLKGPEPSTDKFYSAVPTRFSRVCDEQTFVQFNNSKGFVNEIIPFLPAWCFVDPDSVADHINWEWTENSSISRYISMCATERKRDNEIAWRQRGGRTSIRVYDIDASRMQWGCIRNCARISIDCIFRRTEETLDDVVFINARHLIDVFGITGRIKKPAALRGAKDEWLAVQRIPREMIVDVMNA